MNFTDTFLEHHTLKMTALFPFETTETFTRQLSIVFSRNWDVTSVVWYMVTGVSKENATGIIRVDSEKEALLTQGQAL